MKIDEFLEKLESRLRRVDNKFGGDALIFFDCLFRGSFARAMDAIPPQNWQELSKRDWESIYGMAAGILWDAACSSSSEAHPNTFKEATAVSVAFSQEVKESLGIELASITIQSPTDMMVEAGLLETREEADGKCYVRLSKKGERVAEEVEEEINRITK